MDSWLGYLFVAAGYLSGAVPYSLLVARARGVDLRRVGSGNIGATNVARNLGLRWGVLALLLDALKGFGPVLAARLLLPAEGHGAWLLGATMVAAVAGHMFTFVLLFRGGKGVATALGSFLAVCPLAGLVGAVLYVGLYAALRISSVGSMALTVSVPVAMWLLGVPAPLLVATGVIAVLIVIKHIPNLRRLARGEEGRLSSR